MFDSELVVTCHCPVPKHQQIYYVEESGALGTPLGAEVKYVDPTCPENSWDKIADNSKTYVWGMYCPVYILLLRAIYQDLCVNVIVDILDNSDRVLKNGGSVIFPENGIINSDRTDKLYEIQQFINNLTSKNWKLTLINANEFSFNLGYINSSNFLRVPNILYVFTKIEKLQSEEELQSEKGGRRKRVRKNLTKKLRSIKKKLSKKKRTRRHKNRL